MIPVIAVGPSWAIWPTLADLGILLFIIALVFQRGSVEHISAGNRHLFRYVLLMALGAALSFALVIIFDPLGFSSTRRGLVFGYFQLYRLGQIIIVLFAVMRIKLDRFRIKLLSSISLFVFSVICIGIILTRFSLVPTSTFVKHLPLGFDVAGPWHYYVYSPQRGVGTIGYNHGYAALQVLMFLSLRLHLHGNTRNLFNTILVVISVVIVFFTESRAGLVGIVFFVFIYWSQRPQAVIVVSLIVLVFALVIAPWLAASDIPLVPRENTLERALTIMDPFDPANLAGRDRIWRNYFETLSNSPLRWITGFGFGTAANSTNNAHMLPLHVIAEVGLIGLTILTLMFSSILKHLWRSEGGAKPIFWTTIALIFTGISQETFYPVPAFGHFLGLYICSVGIALRIREPVSHETSPDYLPDSYPEKAFASQYVLGLRDRL